MRGTVRPTELQVETLCRDGKTFFLALLAVLVCLEAFEALLYMLGRRLDVARGDPKVTMAGVPLNGELIHIRLRQTFERCVPKMIENGGSCN